MIGICLAALSLVLATSALAGPAGSEYLPKVPQSGAGSSAEPTGTTSLPQPQPEKKPKKQKKKQRKASTVPPASSSDDDDSSGSVLLSPVVLLMVAGVIVIAVGMTMRRRRTRSLKYRAKKHQGARPARGARPTPKGEIVGDGGDRAS